MSVSTPTQPTGEVLTNAPSPFVANWTHATGLSTKAVGIRLVHPFTGAVLRPALVYGTTITKTVASGANISITWTESQFAVLDWGTIYGVQIRGQATNDIWSAWSTAGVFSTNTAPTIPSGLSPSGGTVFTAPPILRCSASDGGLNPVTPTVYAMIRRQSLAGDPDTTITRTMSYVGNGNYQYQTTTADLTATGTYDFFAYSHDGHLYSGSSLTVAGAATSGAVRFGYEGAPTVTITVPGSGQVLTSNTLLVRWSTPNEQRAYKIEVHQNGGYLFGSGVVVSSGKQHTFSNHPLLVNNQSYTVTVEVIDSNKLTGSASRAFSISYAAATSLTGVTATATALGYDTTPTGVVVSWNASGYTVSFRKYLIGRTPVGGGARVALGEITTRTQTVWLDAEGATGVSYIYDVRQEQNNGQVSEPVTANASVTFDGVVLGAVTDPEGFHVDLRYGARRGDEGDWEFSGGADYFRPVGGKTSQAIPDAESTWNPSGNYRLHGDSRATSDQRFRALRDLVERKGTICYRDGRGEVRYVFLDRVRKQNTAMLQSEVSLQFREVSRDIGGAP